MTREEDQLEEVLSLGRQLDAARSENAQLRKDLGKAEEALDWFGEQTNLSLDYQWPDELDVGEWRVFRIHGGVNDREWTEVATAETPLKAFQAARSALTAPPSKIEGE